MLANFAILMFQEIFILSLVILKNCFSLLINSFASISNHVLLLYARLVFIISPASVSQYVFLKPYNRVTLGKKKLKLIAYCSCVYSQFLPEK